MQKFTEFLKEETEADKMIGLAAYMRTVRSSADTGSYAAGRLSAHAPVLDERIKELDDYFSKKEIFAVQLGAIADTLKSFYEGIMDGIISSATFIDWMHTVEDRTAPIDFVNELYYGNRTLTGAAGQLKRVEKCLQKFPREEILLKIKECAAVGVIIKEKIDRMKPFVKKGRVPNQNAIPKFLPTFSRDAHKQCVVMFTAQIEKIRAEHTKAIYDLYVRQAEPLMKTWIGVDPEEMRKHWKQIQPFQDVWNNIRNNEGSRSYYEPIEFHTDWRSRLMAKVKRDVQIVYDRYILKNAGKLAAIIDNKKESPTVDDRVWRNGIVIESSMKISFSDGSHFTMNNSIEWAVSTRGTEFVRLPTRFSEVIMADGNRMSQPSEEKMNKEFK